MKKKRIAQCFEIKNGVQIIAIYDSAVEAAASVKGAVTAVSACALGKVKSAYGYKWIYVSKETRKT